MTIHLPEELASFIRAEVLSGHFGSEDELVAAAVREYLGRKQAPGIEASGTRRKTRAATSAAPMARPSTSAL